MTQFAEKIRKKERKGLKTQRKKEREKAKQKENGLSSLQPDSILLGGGREEYDPQRQCVFAVCVCVCV